MVVANQRGVFFVTGDGRIPVVLWYHMVEAEVAANCLWVSSSTVALRCARTRCLIAVRDNGRRSMVLGERVALRASESALTLPRTWEWPGIQVKRTWIPSACNPCSMW